MKYTYILFISLLILTSCGSGDCTYTHDIKDKNWSDDYQVVFEGKGYDRSNNQIYVRTYDGEEITGTYCSFDTKGRQTRKENYLNGKLNGLELVYDKYKGIVTDTIRYENGYKEGEEVHYSWSDYHNKLILTSKTNYSKNLKNGFEIEYFDIGESEDKIFRKKGNYKNGFEDGYWELNHSNGKISSKRSYKDGMFFGLVKQYDDDGLISSVSEHVESENGEIITKNEWTWRTHTFGKKVWCQVKKDGKNIYFSFDREGNVMSDQEFNKEHKSLVHYDFDGYSDWTVEGYSY